MLTIKTVVHLFQVIIVFVSSDIDRKIVQKYIDEIDWLCGTWLVTHLCTTSPTLLNYSIWENTSKSVDITMNCNLLLSLIVLLIITEVNFAQDDQKDPFPPCNWSPSQWATFKQCCGRSTTRLIMKCIRTQTQARGWLRIQKAVCVEPQKKGVSHLISYYHTLSVFFSYRIYLWLSFIFSASNVLNEANQSSSKLSSKY